MTRSALTVHTTRIELALPSAKELRKTRLRPPERGQSCISGCQRRLQILAHPMEAGTRNDASQYAALVVPLLPDALLATRPPSSLERSCVSWPRPDGQKENAFPRYARPGFKDALQEPSCSLTNKVFSPGSTKDIPIPPASPSPAPVLHFMSQSRRVIRHNRNGDTDIMQASR